MNGGGCRRRVPKQKFWLVCTVGGGSEALFTVPLSIAKKLKPKSYPDIFEVLARVLFVSNTGGDPLDFQMFRYDPFRGAFAVRTKTSGYVTACFLENMPWLSFSEELLGLKDFLQQELGIPSHLLISSKIHEGACRVGTQLVKVPVG